MIDGSNVEGVFDVGLRCCHWGVVEPLNGEVGGRSPMGKRGMDTVVVVKAVRGREGRLRVEVMGCSQSMIVMMMSVERPCRSVVEDERAWRKQQRRMVKERCKF